MKKIYNQQMAMFNSDYLASFEVKKIIVCILFSMISLFVALVAFIIMSIYELYHRPSLSFLLLPQSKKAKIYNLYLSGYSLLFIIFLTWFCFFSVIAILFAILNAADISSIYNTPINFTIKNMVELAFCILLYQSSVFYILSTKKQKGMTNLNKKLEFLLLLIIMRIIFTFVENSILKAPTLMNCMYVFAGISLIAFPFISLKKIEKGI